jgi:hypothetical protein
MPVDTARGISRSAIKISSHYCHNINIRSETCPALAYQPDHRKLLRLFANICKCLPNLLCVLPILPGVFGVDGRLPISNVAPLCTPCLGAGESCGPSMATLLYPDAVPRPPPGPGAPCLRSVMKRCFPSVSIPHGTLNCSPTGPAPQLPVSRVLGGELTASEKRFGGSLKSVTRPLLMMK